MYLLLPKVEKFFRRGLLSHVTLEATDHTMLGHNRMTRNKFGDDIRIRIDIKSSTKKNHKSEKKGTPPSPKVFRNLFDNVRSKIKILSQTNTNYIGRPSAKQDYTNSSECYSQPLSVGIVPPFFVSFPPLFLKKGGRAP